MHNVFYFYNRTILAALHFNSNVRRKSNADDTGAPKLIVSYPKYKHGEGSLKESKVPQSYGMLNAIVPSSDIIPATRILCKEYKNSNPTVYYLQIMWLKFTKLWLKPQELI